MNEPSMHRTRDATPATVIAAVAAVIAIGLLGAVTALFHSRGLPMEELAAAARACSGRTYVSEREHCIREWLAARANRVANR